MINGINYFKEQKIKLGIVCPMANESEKSIQFVDEVLNNSSKYEFSSIYFFAIFDNTCKDGTYHLLKEYSIKEKRLIVIFAPDNKCVVDAYFRGYKEALNSNCDWILEIDAGYSHSPKDISKFLNIRSNYDCVFGSRFLKESNLNSSMKRHIISKGGTLLVNFLIGTKLSDMTSGFELFSKKALSEIVEKGVNSKGGFFQTEIRTYAHKFNITEVPITYIDPSKKKMTKSLMDAFINLFKLFINVRLKKN